MPKAGIRHPAIAGKIMLSPTKNNLKFIEVTPKGQKDYSLFGGFNGLFPSSHSAKKKTPKNFPSLLSPSMAGVL